MKIKIQHPYTRLDGVSRTRWVALAMLVLCTSAPSGAEAQGTAFTYQGQLQNNGSPANGNYGFTFALFNTNSTSGSQIGGTLTNLDVGVTNGLFIVTLNFGDVFAGNATWLAIGVRSNGDSSFTALSPLQELTPTPYAIYAPNAGSATSAGSVSAANIVGTIPVTQLPAGVVTNGASGVQITGTFSGNGAGLTNVNSSNLTGTLPLSTMPTLPLQTPLGTQQSNVWSYPLTGPGTNVVQTGYYLPTLGVYSGLQPPSFVETNPPMHWNPGGRQILGGAYDWLKNWYFMVGNGINPIAFSNDLHWSNNVLPLTVVFTNTGMPVPPGPSCITYLNNTYYTNTLVWTSWQGIDDSYSYCTTERLYFFSAANGQSNYPSVTINRPNGWTNAAMQVTMDNAGHFVAAFIASDSPATGGFNQFTPTNFIAFFTTNGVFINTLNTDAGILENLGIAFDTNYGNYFVAGQSYAGGPQSLFMVTAQGHVISLDDGIADNNPWTPGLILANGVWLTHCTSNLSDPARLTLETVDDDGTFYDFNLTPTNLQGFFDPVTGIYSPLTNAVSNIGGLTNIAFNFPGGPVLGDISLNATGNGGGNWSFVGPGDVGTTYFSSGLWEEYGPGSIGTIYMTNDALVVGGTLTATQGFASFGAATYTINATGYTNTGLKEIRIPNFAGTSVRLTNMVSGVNITLGTVTAELQILQPHEALIGTLCSGNGVDF